MAAHVKDWTGTRKGRLVVIRRDGYREHPSGRRSIIWLCQCDCGRETRVTSANLHPSGTTYSCGCQRADANRQNGMQNYRHGHSIQTATYKSWAQMKNRCSNPNNAQWADYGGRGIIVCETWMEFTNFLADMGKRPRGLSIDRIDNDKGYEPGNCRWATRKEQNSNTRRNVYVLLDGQRVTATEAARRLGFGDHLILQRLKHGRPLPARVAIAAA